MALIKSISGIRGTIGGKPNEGLTPIDVVKYTAAFAQVITANIENKKIVIGRDGRISGEIIERLAIATLQSMGISVINLGLSTTPTVEIAVKKENAAGGIILTASHNPKEWNALKLLNAKGEFISAEEGQQVLELGNSDALEFSKVENLGSLEEKDYLDINIKMILEHPLVDVEAIKSKNFSIVVDAINSSGAIYIPALLNALGVQKIDVLNAEINGIFAHNPEPLPEHLTEISSRVVTLNANLGIVVDPDVDRLCFVNEDGSMFGEEYTLVAIADYYLQHKKGNTVSNLSSTRALQDVTEKHGGNYAASAVGEVNVVKLMKETNALIGGEGNGGIIIPELHYGRDALIGIALFLSHLAKFGKPISLLRKSYPNYFISKNKINLTADIDVPTIFEKIKELYKNQPMLTIDGLKIIFDKEWVHLRTSNTEPIIRIYAESENEESANRLAKKLINDIKSFLI